MTTRIEATGRGNQERFSQGGSATAFSETSRYPRPCFDLANVQWSQNTQTPFWPGHVGCVAIDWLVDESPNGTQSIRIIATEIGRGRSTSQAFRTAFNIELDDFYARFEPFRQALRQDPVRPLRNRPALINIGE